MRLCRSSHADMKGLTYNAASWSRLLWRSCSCVSDHVQTAHSPIATEMSHCMGNSLCHAAVCGCFIARRAEDHARIVLHNGVGTLAAYVAQYNWAEGALRCSSRACADCPCAAPISCSWRILLGGRASGSGTTRGWAARA